MRPIRTIGIVGALLALAFTPRRSSAPQRPAPVPTPAPKPTPKADAGDGYEEAQRSFAARIGAAETIREVGALLAEAERTHAGNPKLIQKCRRKATARINHLTYPLPF